MIASPRIRDNIRDQRYTLNYQGSTYAVYDSECWRDTPPKIRSAMEVLYFLRRDPRLKLPADHFHNKGVRFDRPNRESVMIKNSCFQPWATSHKRTLTSIDRDAS